MSRHHRLSTLQMSETRQHDLGVQFTAINEGSLQFQQQFINRGQRITHVKLQVRRHLIVATSSRMQLATDVTDPLNQSRFDMHMNVFEFGLPDHLAACNLITDDRQCLNNLAAFVGR